MAKGKRSGHRAEDIIASRAMKHHDFVGGADSERAEAQKQKQEHVERSHEKLEAQVVREMNREMESAAGLAAGAGKQASAPAAGQQQTKHEAPPAGPDRGLFSRGFSFFEEVRDNAPLAFEALHNKAEERLASLPKPIKRVLHRGEQAAALLLAPARIGMALARELLKAPLHLFEAFRRRAA